MNRLNEFLTDEVKAYNSNLTDGQVSNIAAGLEHYINEYMAEQIPEQIDNELTDF